MRGVEQAFSQTPEFLHKDGMKMFISHGVSADKVTALRLRALAAVNGLTAFVPPEYTRKEF